MATMRQRHDAILAIVRDCRDPDMSDMDAVLNLVEHHADTIKRQQLEIDRLNKVISDAVDHFKSILSNSVVV